MVSLAAEITGRFKDSQNRFQHNNTPPDQVVIEPGDTTRRTAKVRGSGIWSSNDRKVAIFAPKAGKAALAWAGSGW
jgi:hypothetical protein